MPDPRPCCILGVCCDPGGDAQRADLRSWLLEKLSYQRPTPDGAATHAASAASILGLPPSPRLEATIDEWLDDLYADATK